MPLGDESGDDGPVLVEPRVTFRVLGPLEVWHDGERLMLGGRHQDRVLAVLLLNVDRAVTVTRLVEAVWGEDPPSTAAHQIRKIVAQLRHALPQTEAAILTDGLGYRLDVGRVQVDLLQHEWHLERATVGSGDEAAHLDVALALWRGPALSGIAGPVLGAASTALDDLRAVTLERLATRRISEGGGADLVGVLRAQLAEHPLRETTRGLLMVALYRAGRQAEALSAYDEGRRLLRDELGVDPSRELTRIHEQILRNDPVLSPAAPTATPTGPIPTPMGLASTLPYDVPDFTGRTAELAALLTSVPETARQALTIVTVDGMAGVGKTTLAVHAAHLLADRFPDGQLYLDLHGFAADRLPLDPAEALDMLLRAIGVPGELIPDRVADRSAMWRDGVARRSLLLLLDNAVDSAQVLPLVPGASGSLVIATSRSRLTGVDGAVPLSLVSPSADECRALLERILGAQRVAAEPGPVDELIEVCGGLPLALRVAAARLRNRPSWSFDHLVTRLRRAERRLDELAVDDRSVAAAFRLSYDGLAPEHQRLFRLLGLHPCLEFGVPSAAALAGIRLQEADDGLEALLDARQVENRRPEHYTFHNLSRSFARHVVETDEPEAERSAALRRLYDAILSTVQHVSATLQPGHVAAPPLAGLQDVPLPELSGPGQAFAWMDAEYSTLITLTRDASALGFPAHAGELANALSYYLQIRGPSRTQGELLVLGLSGARQAVDEPLELRCLSNLFIPLWHSGRFPEALDCAEKALRLAQKLGDEQAQGVLSGHVGIVHSSLGQNTEALNDFGRALDIHGCSGNRHGEAVALVGIAVSTAALGRHVESLQAAKDSLNIHQELGDEARQVVALVNIAVAQTRLGDTGSALVALGDARRMAGRVGSPLADAMITSHYALVYRRAGRLHEALDHALRARALFEPLDRPDALVDLLNLLGGIHSDCGRNADALAAHTEALAGALRLGLRVEEVRALDGTARALLATGDTLAAGERWTEALSLAQELELPEAVSIAEGLAALG